MNRNLIAKLTDLRLSSKIESDETSEQKFEKLPHYLWYMLFAAKRNVTSSQKLILHKNGHKQS